MKETLKLLIGIFIFVLLLFVTIFIIVNSFESKHIKTENIETETIIPKISDTNPQKEANLNMYKTNNFIVISEDIIPNSESDSKKANCTIIKTVVDKRTKIMYFLTIFVNEQRHLYYPSSHTSNLQVILNSEGKPLLYEKELP